MATPSDRPEMLAEAHRNSSPSGFGDHNGHPVINLDQPIAFDEPLASPPYWNDSVTISPLGDASLQSALLPNAGDHSLSMGQIMPPPLTPMPLRHSSLYQVLKQDPPPSPVPQSAASSIAHALELQEPQVRQASLSHTPVLGNAPGPTIGASENALSACQAPLTVVAVGPNHTLPHGHTLPVSSRPSSSMGPPISSSQDSMGTLESTFALDLLGRKRPVLRAKLACLFCRQRKIPCRPLVGDCLDSITCQ
jgi:hypothetical protein